MYLFPEDVENYLCADLYNVKSKMTKAWIHLFKIYLMLPKAQFLHFKTGTEVSSELKKTANTCEHSYLFYCKF